MSIKSKYALILILTIFNLSCFQYKEVEIIKVSDIKLKEFSTKGINVEVALQISNPNKYKISIVDADLVLLIKDKRMGIANINEKIVLPKKSNQIHRFTIHSTLKDVGSGAIPLLLGIMIKAPIELQVQGDIKARAKGISKTIPININEKVKL